MQIPELDLNKTFFCHSHAPKFGFWGELRRMIVEDMTLYQGIEFHNERAFQFKHGFTHIPLTHEIPHQLLAIAAIYSPRFRFLLPDVDAETGFLKPNGYNGFSDGEDFVTSIEHGLLKAIVYQKFEAPNLSKQAFMEQINQLIIHGENLSRQKADYVSWVIADQQEKPTSVHEVKKSFGYDHHDLSKAVKRIPMETRPKATAGTKNSHGETIPYTRAFNIDDYEALYDSLQPAIEYLNKVFVERDGYVTDLKEVWGDIKIRKLHELIGGKEAAAEYFRHCGVQQPATKKAASLDAA